MPSRFLRKPHGAIFLLLVSSIIVLTSCGGAPSSDSSPTRAATDTSSPATTPYFTPSPTRRVDVTAAVAAALALYTRSPNNVNDPSAGYIWSSGIADPRSPISAKLRERLLWLTSQDYFGDTHCGEDYVDGNQVGLDRPPMAISAAPNSDASVTVVVRGYLNSDYRDLTVVMSQINGTWLATDLRRGTGPDASIFAAHPNC